jgi:hypothetical protein
LCSLLDDFGEASLIGAVFNFKDLHQYNWGRLAGRLAICDLEAKPGIPRVKDVGDLVRAMRYELESHLVKLTQRMNRAHAGEENEEQEEQGEGKPLATDTFLTKKYH